MLGQQAGDLSAMREGLWGPTPTSSQSHKPAEYPSRPPPRLRFMNTSKIIVRLEAEERTAELEMMVPHGSREIEGIETAIRRIGMLTTRRVDVSTPKYRVTRLKVAELDGSVLGSTRVMQVLRAVRRRELEASHDARNAA